ncbi:MAG: DUF2752 domain-containing protein [Candidatus Eisenbacteria bacterium]|nr:DUF2752 domain-containing protein [Candidatus Eisenbacteria bacterium]
MASETRSARNGSSGLVWGAILGGGALATAGGARFLSETIGYSVPCPFHVFAGVPCPTCFGLRALAALGHGRIGEAIALHPFFALGAILLAAWGVISVALLLAGKRALPAAWGRTAARAALWAIPIALAVNWIYLLLWTRR